MNYTKYLKALAIMHIVSIFIIIAITLYFTCRIDGVDKRADGVKLFKNEEFQALKNDIKFIYNQTVQIGIVLGEHETRIYKLEPESPIIQTYLKNIKALTETISMHRKELLKWQKNQKE